MKKNKTKLPFSKETVRTLSKSLSDEQLDGVAGGFSTTIIISKCAQTTGPTCPD